MTSASVSFWLDYRERDDAVDEVGLLDDELAVDLQGALDRSDGGLNQVVRGSSRPDEGGDVRQGD